MDPSITNLNPSVHISYFTPSSAPLIENQQENEQTYAQPTTSPQPRQEKVRKKRMHRSFAAKQGVMISQSPRVAKNKEVPLKSTEFEQEKLKQNYEAAQQAAQDWWAHPVQSENPAGRNYFPPNPQALGLDSNDWANWQIKRNAFQQQWSDKGNELQQVANEAYQAYISYIPGENPSQTLQDQIHNRYQSILQRQNELQMQWDTLEAKERKLQEEVANLPLSQQHELQNQLNALKQQMEAISNQKKQTDAQFLAVQALYTTSQQESNPATLQQNLNELKQGTILQDLNSLDDQIQKASKSLAAIQLSIQPSREESPLNQGDILQIEGISLYKWNGLYFPVGLVLPLGQPGDFHNYSPSEAWGYAIRNAVESKDQGLFQKLATSYLYFANQTEVARGNKGIPHAWGLMGWSPDIINGKFPSDTPFFSSASDADEDIINGLIQGLQLFGDMEFNDSLTPAGTSIRNSISLKEMIIEAGRSFVKNDLGTATLGGHTAYMLVDNNWGHDAVHPDYFDPQMFANLITFFEHNNQNGQFNSEIANLKTAAQNTMTALMKIAHKNGGWIPDGPYDDPATPNKFGYEAVRILIRLAQYIATPGEDLLHLKEEATILLKNLVGNIIPHCSLNNGTYQFNPSGLSRGQFTGPLLLALKALQSQQALPSNVTAETIKQVEQCFQHDLKDYDTSSRQAWQERGYFCMQLALLSQSLMKDLHL